MSDKLKDNNPAGPFVATDSKFWFCTHVLFGGSGDGFSLCGRRDEAERLVAWLNDMVAEREAGE